MDDPAGSYALDRIHQSREQWMVVFHSVPLDVDDNDSESDLFEIVLVFKTLVDGDQNVALALGLGNQPGIRKGTPFGFGNGQDFVIGKSLPQARIDALV